jgi:hypothetical protein
MLNSVEAHSSRGQTPLTQWLARTVGRSGLRVKFQVQGNHLHILCEGSPCPERVIVLNRLLPALKRTHPNTLTLPQHPEIYHVSLYGREAGQVRPRWTVPIALNQLDRHLEQLQAAQPTLATVGQAAASQAIVAQATVGQSRSIAQPSPPHAGAEITLSNRSLARRGDAIAIARYLSETLSALGVAVRVTVKTVPYLVPEVNSTGAAIPLRRLWITCEANYSPDPALIGEPIAYRLRDLELEGFRDAIALIQVWGEAKPDWVLRVDLTPTHEMLREWARWGDVGAIARLLSQAVADHGICLDTTTLKESTLHLCWSLARSQTEATPNHAPDQPFVTQLVAPLLEQLAPQGIHAAMLYGQIKGQDTPAWAQWLNLPASQHSALADSALNLAQQGDWGAIAFLLDRLLNPDLDQQLATGGVRLHLLPKQDLLHVMVDAPVCPQQRQVVPTVIRFLRQLQLSRISGVRIYGRRSGQKRPLWSDGADFTPRQRLVPEATPEFAATDAFIGDLIARSDDIVLRPDLTAADLQSVWGQFQQRLVEGTQQLLTCSQLFVVSPDAVNPDAKELATLQPSPTHYQGIWTGLVWAIAGLLLVVQIDWLVERVLRSPSVATSSTAIAPSPTAVFSTSRLTASAQSEGRTDSTVRAASPLGIAATPSTTVTASPFATFNSWQLDQKLALYLQQVADEGAPDVLIVGSSRALRGVDPVALQQTLTELGYPNPSIFNFGINGATAQVVDLLLRQILTPEQMPQLILWADGARALNSSALDVTYNGIAASEGYRQIAQTSPLLPTNNSPADGTTTPTLTSGVGVSLTASYQTIDRWLSQHLARALTTYEKRDRLKSLLQSTVTTRLPQETLPLAGIPVDPASPSIPSQGQGMIDLNGFLPLSLRFNPATYYQQYARVSGEYDSDYESFQLVGKQADALNALLQFTRDRQIPLIFVNLPLTQEYLDSTRLQHEQEFKQYMLRLALSKQGLVFRDLDQIWLTQNDYFSDPSHLNRYGAYEVSRQLAQDPMIPWMQPR